MRGGLHVGRLVCRNMLREKYGSKLGGKVLLEAKDVAWVELTRLIIKWVEEEVLLELIASPLSTPFFYSVPLREHSDGNGPTRECPGRLSYTNLFSYPILHCFCLVYRGHSTP